MRRLKRSECSVLHLGLKGVWYRHIESGGKSVEFREYKRYWISRVENWLRRDGIKVLEFQNGYGRFSPRMWFVAGSVVSLGNDDPVTRPDQGEFAKARFAIGIGERVALSE